MSPQKTPLVVPAAYRCIPLLTRLLRVQLDVLFHLSISRCPAERMVLMAVGGAERARPEPPAVEGSSQEQGEKVCARSDSGAQELRGRFLEYLPHTLARALLRPCLRPGPPF